MKKIVITIFLVICSVILFAALSNLPKHEFRGAWIATVINLDWPSSPHSSTQSQKADLINQLNELKKTGINAVIFQVRTECDALYNSNYEPWSYWLTGSQGLAPSPYYDPLQFAIEEAHKRGMELHAWFNPYRVERNVGNYSIHPTHVSVQHPDWVIQIGDIKILDPGLPMVRDFVTDVIMDVVQRYDVDGIHFDDYFYPYPPNNISTTNADVPTYNLYPRGFSNIHDWRRDNVNIFVEQIKDSISVIKPYVKFGISPFGIWQNGVPSGITGLSAYHTIYCDALAWLTAQTVDYIAPQCYWRIGGGQDYSLLVPWWGSQLNSRHLYVGQIINSSYTNNELPNQMQINRQTSNVSGNIIFRSKILVNNDKAFKDSLINNYFKYPAITPIMSWKDSIPPNEPQNIRYENLPDSTVASIQWDLPLLASDGDSASRYVIYKFNYIPTNPGDLTDPENIMSIEGLMNYTPPEPNDAGPYNYVITSLDRNSNESVMSSVLTINSPTITQLIYPPNDAINLPDSIQMYWENPDPVSKYHLQISTDSMFANLAVNFEDIEDTAFVLTDLEGEAKYFWRVSARNAGGTSPFSEVYNFETGFPGIPELAYPPHNTLNQPLEPTLGWNSVQTADYYRLQIAISADFNTQSIVFDSIGFIDTSVTVGPLQGNKRHYWKVKAINNLGSSLWSESRRFKTLNPSSITDFTDVPLEYNLGQNFPNPFNSSTNISFSLKEAGIVTLKVFDIKGQEILILINKYMNAGQYNMDMNLNHIASGIYIYALKIKDVILYKKMMLVK